MELTIVIPTLGRLGLLRRVLDCLERQSIQPQRFEVVVVADANERDLPGLEAAVAKRSYPARLRRGSRPGAAAARNAGWRDARSDLVLFLDDDILPEPALVVEHLRWHERNPDPLVGVLGHVRWADELAVTPFMRWLEHGIQFDYPSIDGVEAGWGYFYTANVSVKKMMLDRVRGFEEVRLPFGYEDLDIAWRMRDLGFRLLYNRAAVAQHLHPMDLDFWRRRVVRIAQSERAFVDLHPEFQPYFFELFTAAAAAPRARGLGKRLARFVPRSVPWLGARVWGSADAVYRHALAGPFLAAWEAAARSSGQSGGGSTDRSPSGSRPSGPK